MGCFFPVSGYYGKDVNPETGKRPIVFKETDAWSPTPVRLPCGECVGCLSSRALNWATRICHETRMSSESAFVTLTYSPAHLPVGGSLVKYDLQCFMKRLRLRRPKGLRFFACGEYGEQFGRPHYHILLLNSGFPDMRYYKDAAGGFRLHQSAELGQLWPFGEHYIGQVTGRSAAYVARYVTKKLGSKQLDGREPEFQVMSRRPGLGLAWFEHYGIESYRHDNCVVDGHKVPLPRYYDSKFEAVDSSRLSVVKLDRRRKMLSPEARANNTHQRRVVREQFEHRKIQRFRRDPT